jgi:hypothetical protein
MSTQSPAFSRIPVTTLPLRITTTLTSAQVSIQNPSSVHFRLQSNDMNHPPTVLSTLCSVLEICECFEETCFLHLRNVRTLQDLGTPFLQDYNEHLPDQIGGGDSVVWFTGWAIQGSKPGKGSRFISPPNHPDRLWAPPSFLFNG